MSGSWGLCLLGLGYLLGGFTAYWFEDVLRGPIMRHYDEHLTRREILVLDDGD